MNTDTRTPIGLSEIVTLLTLGGSMLTAVFGHDWGITVNAQHYAGIAVVLLPIGLSLARAIKHTGNVRAAAIVTAAAVAAPAVTPPTPVTAPDAADPYPGGDDPALAVPQPV